ncbi:MAG: hypothetical protein ACI4MN_02755 [Candidatus Coproplasma sp.]
MNIRKLKLATGIVGLLGVLLAVICYICNIAFLLQGEGNLGVAIIAVIIMIIGIPLGIAALIEFVFSIIYTTGKVKARAFYITGAVLSVLDLFIGGSMIFLALVSVDAAIGVVVPLLDVIGSLPMLAVTVLKIVCAVKIKKEVNTENLSING